MKPIRLTKTGVQKLYEYIIQTKPYEIFDLRPKHNAFLIGIKGKNWFNRKFGLSVIGAVRKEIGERFYYFHPDTNLIYELKFKQLLDLLNKINEVKA